jgi:hypothetical protein
MLRKIIASVLLLSGGIIFFVLLAVGSPLWPHSLGPIVLVTSGGVLFSKLGQRRAD